MVERSYLFDGDLATTGSVYGRTDDTVRSLAYDIEHLVICTYGLVAMSVYVNQRRALLLTDVESDFARCWLCLRSGMGVLRLGRRCGGGGGLSHLSASGVVGGWWGEW